MLGAIIGDIAGSVYEWRNCKTDDPETIGLTKGGCEFTDDSVMTVAVADALLRKRNYVETFKEWGRRYPNVGYGGTFFKWIKAEQVEPYGSWGNGSAMRVSPVGWAFGSIDETLAEAKRSAEVTHNHPEGIKGAQAVAAAIFFARNGYSKSDIKGFIASCFQYDLNRTTASIRPEYKFDVSCQGSVPEAIICFLESTSYENSLKLAISLGGDSDTIACIAGGIAEAYYKKIPEELVRFASSSMPFEMNRVVADFRERFHIGVDEKEVKNNV